MKPFQITDDQYIISFLFLSYFSFKEPIYCASFSKFCYSLKEPILYLRTGHGLTQLCFSKGNPRARVEVKTKEIGKRESWLLLLYYVNVVAPPLPRI